MLEGVTMKGAYFLLRREMLARKLSLNEMSAGARRKASRFTLKRHVCGQTVILNCPKSKNGEPQSLQGVAGVGRQPVNPKRR